MDSTWVSVSTDTIMGYGSVQRSCNSMQMKEKKMKQILKDIVGVKNVVPCITKHAVQPLPGIVAITYMNSIRAYAHTRL